MRELTLSSLAGKGRNGGKTLREDDVGELTLSSRAGKGLYGGETLREDDVGELTLSSRAGGRAERRRTASRGRREGADVVFARWETGGTAAKPYPSRG